MAYALNLQVRGGAFMVPAVVADEHLRCANGQQLKVLLYLLRQSGQTLTAEQLGAGTGLTPADAADAMSYWVEKGIVTADGQPAQTPAVSTAVNRTLQDIPDVVPTHETVVARMLENPDIKLLFNEAQIKLGKTIGYDTQSKLLMMIDAYGLPPEVILCIMEYAVSHGKTSMAYICRVGKEWGESGITTLEAAMDRLSYLDQSDKLWNSFTDLFEVEKPRYTEKRIKFLRKWRLEWKQSNELVFFAYERTVDNINKIQFEYMDKMLESWHKEGWKTPQEVMQKEKQKTAKGNFAKSSNSAGQQTRTPSYDSDAYKKKARGPIAYERRKTNG